MSRQRLHAGSEQHDTARESPSGELTAAVPLRFEIDAATDFRRCFEDQSLHCGGGEKRPQPQSTPVSPRPSAHRATTDVVGLPTRSTLNLPALGTYILRHVWSGNRRFRYAIVDGLNVHYSDARN
jgi:hypothetical protein